MGYSFIAYGLLFHSLHHSHSKLHSKPRYMLIVDDPSQPPLLPGNTGGLYVQ
jgi:hypothetical protein